MFEMMRIMGHWGLGRGDKGQKCVDIDVVVVECWGWCRSHHWKQYKKIHRPWIVEGNKREEIEKGGGGRRRNS